MVLHLVHRRILRQFPNWNYFWLHLWCFWQVSLPKIYSTHFFFCQSTDCNLGWMEWWFWNGLWLWLFQILISILKYFIESRGAPPAIKNQSTIHCRKLEKFLLVCDYPIFSRFICIFNRELGSPVNYMLLKLSYKNKPISKSLEFSILTYIDAELVFLHKT